VEGYFHLESMGQQTIKGLDEPLEVFRVLGSTTAETRIDAARSRLRVLVGRDREATDLDRAWDAATTGAGPGVVLISGEPGIGKSRLVHALKERLGQTAGTSILEGHCSPLRQNAFLRPIIQAVEAAAGLGGAADASGRAERFDKVILELDANQETAALLAFLLSVPGREDPALATLAPGLRRQRTMKALAAFFRWVARKGRLLLVIEDLHWADASTIEFLEFLAATGVPAGMMVLATGRPEFQPAWPPGAFALIGLGRLPPDAAEKIISDALGGDALTPALRRRIIGRAEGVPLFIEEIAKATIEALARRTATERSVAEDSEGLIPPTIRDSLAARIDRLGPSKSVAQLAAIVGREASEELLSAVGLMEEAELKAGLRHLVESGLVLAENRNGGPTYEFRHALIHEVVYHSILKSKRRQYHHRVASVFQDQFPHLAEAEPDTVALHYARAEVPRVAATYFERAGAMAFGAQAYLESSNHFRSALEQIAKLPAGRDRDSRELEARAALGLPLLMTRGYGAPDVQEAYGRALELAAAVQPPLRVLFGIWSAQLVQGNRQNAQQMADRFRAMADASRNPSERLICYAAVGSHAFWRGNFREAIPPLKAAVEQFEPAMILTLSRDYGYDNALWAHLYLAWALQVLGHFAEAQATFDLAWEITKQTGSPYLEVVALCNATAMARDLGDQDKTLEISRRAMALAEEHGLAFFLALGRAQHGWALCQRGEINQGIALIQQGLGFFRAIGVKTPNTLVYLAEAHWRSGAIQEGLEAVDEGIEIAETCIDSSGLSELFLVKARLLVRTESLAEADEYFVRSLELARAQGAVLGVVRTATAFAEELRRRGESRRAVEVLEAALGPVEGENPPLVAAGRRLLRELTQSAR
ncbi:MAG TPA: AAA family ATPase, partial [Polyangia bacterium]